MYEKNKTKKEKSSKDKCSSEETLGRVSKNNQSEVWKCMLYLRGKRIDLIKLANRTHASQGFGWCISKVRPTNSATPMLSLQYKFWGQPSDFYRKYEEVRRRNLRELYFGRPAENFKSIRLVRAVITRI